MLLVKPETYKQDPGRSLPPDEFIQAVRDATPILEIKRKYCAAQGDNSRYRPGKSRS